MQLKYSKTALPPTEAIQKITSLAWAPNKYVVAYG